MVDEIVTRQELIDAKRDARDLGKAVNEKVIVSPRYGEDFKSLPMIAAEFQDAINTIVVEGGVPAVAVSDASGKNQQEINEEQKAQNNNFKSKIRKTPYDFGAKGSGFDDTQAVIDCINSGYFLINDIHNCQPITITGKSMDGVFTKLGKLVFTHQGADSLVFDNCTGFIENLVVSDVRETVVGSYKTVYLKNSKNFTFKGLYPIEGKDLPVMFLDCDNCHVIGGYQDNTSLAYRPFAWQMAGCSSSTFERVILRHFQFGMIQIGANYHSAGELVTADVPVTIRPIMDTLGMQFIDCLVLDHTGHAFDGNGNCGGYFVRCIAKDYTGTTGNPSFQFKQSTNNAAETALREETQYNYMVDCIAYNSAVGFATQNGSNVKIINPTSINSAAQGIVINRTPRTQITNPSIINWGMDVAKYSIGTTSAHCYAVQFESTSADSFVDGLHCFIKTAYGDITKLGLIQSTGTRCQIGRVNLYKAGTVTEQLNHALKITGTSNYIAKECRIGAASYYSAAPVQDTATNTVYPVVSQITVLSNAASLNYFDIPIDTGFIAVKAKAICTTAPTGGTPSISLGHNGGSTAFGTGLALGIVNNGLTVFDLSGVSSANQVVSCTMANNGATAGRYQIQIAGILAV